MFAVLNGKFQVWCYKQWKQSTTSLLWIMISLLCMILSNFYIITFILKIWAIWRTFWITNSLDQINVFLSLNGNTLEILKDSGFLGAKPMNFLMKQNVKISYGEELLRDLSQYRWFISRLIYLTIIQLDIIYYVHILNKFMHAPHKPHIIAI